MVFHALPLQLKGFSRTRCFGGRARELIKAKGEYVLENVLVNIVDSMDLFSLADTEAM